MLLKYSQAQKRMKLSASGKPQRATGMMKLTSTMMNVVPRIHRKVIKNVASKRPNSTHHRIPAASKRHEVRPITVPVDPCDNSNDSGLGFDQHIDYPVPPQQPILRFSGQEVCWSESVPSLKRQRIDIKVESDNANDNYTFPANMTPAQATPLARGSALHRTLLSSPPSLMSQFSSTSRDGRIQLQISTQPEQQHRARYQTEGSRGAVKDRSGNHFPVVRLVGYDRPATIQVFIGTDQGRVAPHMFYQACRVSGKNSTPCVEKRIDGTVVIEIEAQPDRDMIVVCDCVGILKERNVDVEHRFPDESPGRSKKKSTRCRMVFRTTVLLSDGTTEILQAASLPIVCTQPPGIPEIGKKSLIACPSTGGLELFILGKNFLKDTTVVFRKDDDDFWEAIVQPDKEFLQQSHLICVIPPYRHQDIQNPVNIQLMVRSSGKLSEPHDFTYTPPSRFYNLFPVPLPIPTPLPAVSCDDPLLAPSTSKSAGAQVHPSLWPSPVTTTQQHNTSTASISVVDGEMPPPALLVKLKTRRSSVQMIVPETIGREELKQEVSESPRSSPAPKSPAEVVADLTTTQSPSIATLQQFVSGSSSLPSISVENYLSGIEVSAISNAVASYVQKDIGKAQIVSDSSQTSTSQLHSPPIISGCNSVTDIVHSQVINDIPQQTAPSSLLPTSLIDACNTVSSIVQSQIINDISLPPTTPQLHSSQLHSPPISMPSPVKQARYSDSLLQNVSAAIDGTVAPLDGSLLMSTNDDISFTQRLEADRNETSSQCIGSMLSSRNTSSVLQSSTSSLISDSQNLRLSELVSSSMVQSSSTEKLDAFVNSAADSHISPGQSALPPPSSTEVHSIVSHDTSRINPLLQQVSNTCPSTTVGNASLVSLLAGPPVSSVDQPSQTTVGQSLHPRVTSPTRMSDLLVSQNISSEILGSSVRIQSNLPAPSQYSEQPSFSASQEIQASLMSEVERGKPEVKEELLLMKMSSTVCSVSSAHPQAGSSSTLSTAVTTTTAHESAHSAAKKTEEGIPLGSGIQELTQMSEHDLISYINPSCFDQVE